MQKINLFFIVCVVFSSKSVSAVDHIISSEIITDWGVWGSVARCPVGTFVVSWAQKVQPDQGLFGDDTAQNGIEMNCAYPNDPETSILTITSTIGPFGDWTDTVTCEPNFVIGFNLRVESNQGPADDSATNNFRARCDSGELLDGNGTTWGSWRTQRDCDYRHAVCGLQTQVEPDQGSGDDTALNNVNLYCCELPNLAETCVPKEKYTEAIVCDNSRSKSEKECVISYEVGVGYVPGLEKVAKGWEGAGFTLKDAVKDLPKTFKTHMKEKEMTTTFSESIFAERTPTSVTVSIPAGVVSKFSYLTAECEHYSVASRKFERVDSSKDGKVTATTYFYI